ncbi:nitroreductase family protein [Pectinatus brassicae]|uniref:Nitroreductase n=1 Tax=Pectinatus brassicae TaxID=862415 RepID=A0A840UNX7_9FIRM|nr:nitroreductase [Pectinatus brassicae]MBB5336408.1 nitroreductase [Pectinatus brassicae]
MNTLLNIMTRRSIRAYRQVPVKKDDIEAVLKAAVCAPYGGSIQPWRFSVIMKDKKLLEKIASLTICEKWVKDASCLIAVFLDTDSMKDAETPKVYMKHAQAIGAAIQNMLLAANELELGTCWLGEIIKNEESIKRLLEVSDKLELMAVIAIGYPQKIHKGKYKDVNDSIISWK